jgi:hypothetical protein
MLFLRFLKLMEKILNGKKLKNNSKILKFIETNNLNKDFPFQE